ncbi:MAG: fumarylacetoacetate hydrolase family protein [Steroidobacteraceae bacterium]
MSNRRQFIAVVSVALAGTALIDRAEAAATRYAVPPMAVPSLPIERRAERFPVHHIYCMGLNYKKPAESLAKAPETVYFQKSNDSIAENHSTVRYPSMTKDYRYELEMVVAIGRSGRSIPLEKALEHVYGYALGLDMGRWDLVAAALKSGLPWEAGKSFEQSAPCTAIHCVADIGHLRTGRLQLKVNDMLKQDDDIGNMILDVPHIIAFLSQWVELQPGDLIYTGTPAGVGAVVSGDRMVGTLEGIGSELVIKVG